MRVHGRKPPLPDTQSLTVGGEVKVGTGHSYFDLGFLLKQKFYVCFLPLL